MTEQIPSQFHLSIITPQGLMLDERVQWLQVPLEDGLLGIWPGHAPLLGAVAAGELEYSVAGQRRQLEIPTGILRIGTGGAVTLMLGTLFEGDAETLRDREQLAQEMAEAVEETLPPSQLEALQETG